MLDAPLLVVLVLLVHPGLAHREFGVGPHLHQMAHRLDQEVLMPQVVPERLQNRLLLTFSLPRLLKLIPEVAMRALRELLDEVDQKLEAIGVDPLQLGPQHPLLGLHQFFVDKFHFLPAEAGYFGEVVDVAVGPHGLQFEGDLSEQELDADQVLVLDAKLEGLLPPLALDVPVGPMLQQQAYQPRLHQGELVGLERSRLGLPETVVLVLAHRADEVQAGVATGGRVLVVEVVLLGLQKILEHL